MKQTVTRLALLGAAATLGMSHAQATILAQVWENVSTSISTNATIANAPTAGTGAYAEFNPTTISYDSNVSGYTVGAFYNNPTFFNATGSFSATNTLEDSYALFTGQTYLVAGANSFSTPHDDGFELVVTGAYSDAAETTAFDLSQPGPTAATTTPYTVYATTAGYYNFELSYGECCGAPAVLGFTVNGAPVTGVPEPLTLALIGGGLMSFGVVRRRK